ncbi:MAG TPA: IS3 family transposase [Candidatus Brocadiia bacterium]|nr:IS3 family transposase [Candidatus Brocadiia bacterium]
MHYWSARSEFPIRRLLQWLDLPASKFYDWRRRYSRPNGQHASVPQGHRLEEWERRAIVEFFDLNPTQCHRRLAYMMLDQNIAAASPATVYRVLKQAGRIKPPKCRRTGKGKGFDQPDGPHKHWHIDLIYLKIRETFYYMCSILDGFSRYVVHWEIRERMTQRDVEVILQRARELYPDAQARLISDNGPQFIGRDFKSYISLCNMDHTYISRNYPQSNGKIERWHKSLRGECIRPRPPISDQDARDTVARFVDYYNNERLHSAIGYVTPKDKLEGRAELVIRERKDKLQTAREARRQSSPSTLDRNWPLTGHRDTATMAIAGETEAVNAGEQTARDSQPGGDEYRPGGVTSSPCTLKPPRSDDILSYPNASENSKLAEGKPLPQAGHQLRIGAENSNSR